jgi:tetratricopeptide (TPR) repeat protein
MQTGCSRLTAIAFVFLGGWVLAWPQGLPALIVRGEAQTGASLVNQATAELFDLRSHDRVAISDVRSDGTFDFPSVPSGLYRLAFTDPRGDVIYETEVSVGGAKVIQVSIPDQRVNRPPSGGVSVAQLMHPPDRKAVQAALAAQKLSAAGDYAGAAEKLERAVQISPDFADAYANLAAQHIRLGKYPQALDEIARAAEIAGPTALSLCNAAAAQVALGRQSQAMDSLWRALELDPQYAQAHYLLGGLLSNDLRTLSEAVLHLEQAAQTMPAARAVLEKATQNVATVASLRH